ncbi:DEAD/DEAH box helicase [Parafilimonas sp.]|uniref:DEAD/DEAH box helicase n=1 Tax=Parafilimonas sp. TaxID=1969739 RepID=UPI0039E62CCA
MNVTLRDYQINGINDITNAWTDCRSILFQMPTGTGKTTLFCEIVRKFTTELYPDKKVLIITHRKELVEQAFNRLASGFHLTAGIISSNYISIQSAPVQVASIQTLVRRDEHQKDIFSLVVIDEAHHALASTYKKLWGFYPGAKFLGVTATPIRTNGEGFEDLFDKLVTTPSVKWFIKNNYLSDVKYYASHFPDISNVKITAGDYDETELSEIMQDKAVMADLVQSYKEFALDKKMIVFAVNRAHSLKIVEKYNSSGFVAKVIDTSTPTDERRKIVDDFRNNRFKILCNVNIFTEGFDCPDVDAVQLARPTKSLALFLQQVGRCMRPHQNKEHGIILDNAGLWKEHGLPKMNRSWTLYGVDKNAFSAKQEIIGIKEIAVRENNEPQESKGIRLVEFGELENINEVDIIDFNDIEKNLTDKKITTMRERIETLVKKIQKYEQLKADGSDDEDIRIFDEQIKKFKQELSELQSRLQPQRFEQVLELIIEKCQDVINSNEIFVDGDKDVFLKQFVEPYLKNLFDNTVTNDKTSYTANVKARVFKGLDEGLTREQVAKKYDLTRKQVADTAWAWENEKMFKMFREGNNIDSVAKIYGEKRAHKAYELLIKAQ